MKGRFLNVKLVNLSILFCCVFLLWSGCGQRGPSESVIEHAKQRTQYIIDSLRITDNFIQGKLKLSQEYYQSDSNRYVLRYKLKTEFGAPVTSEPTVYILKKGDHWIYEFDFDRLYESKLAG
jgi:hypothetical protein